MSKTEAELTDLVIAEGLRALPATVVEVLNLCNHPESGIAEVAAVVETDPTLVAEVSRLAESVAYGRAGRAQTVEDAVGMIGLRVCEALAVGVALRRVAEADQSALHTVVQQSAMCAATAETLARRHGVHPHQALFAGLLAYIGELAIAQHAPEDFAVLVSRGVWQSPIVQERAIGIMAPRIAAKFLTAWGCARHVIDAVASRVPDDTGRRIEPLSINTRRAAELSAALMNQSGIADALLESLNIEREELPEIIEAISATVPESTLITGGDPRRLIRALDVIKTSLLALEESTPLLGRSEAHHPISGLPTADALREFVGAIEHLMDGSAEQVGAILFGLPRQGTEEENQRTLEAAALRLHGRVRAGEMLGHVTDSVLAIVVPETDVEELDLATARFERILAEAPSEHALQDIEVRHLIGDVQSYLRSHAVPTMYAGAASD